MNVFQQTLNCLLILTTGDNGCVLIDTGDSWTAGKQFMEKMNDLLEKKPIKAIILTHFHPDHTSGASVFLKRYITKDYFITKNINFTISQIP